MQTVAETPLFTKLAEGLFDEVEKQALITYLAENQLAGDVITGTAGVRKLRYAASGRGKRGGARVIYYYYDDTVPLYALLVYAKNERADLTPDEKHAVAKLVEKLKSVWSKK